MAFIFFQCSSSLKVQCLVTPNIDNLYEQNDVFETIIDVILLSRLVKAMAYLIKYVENALKNSALPIYSNSSVNGQTQNLENPLTTLVSYFFQYSIFIC